MLAIAVAGLFALQNTPIESDSARAVREGLAACGIAAEEIEIRYEEVLQDYAAIIRTPASRLDERQLACIARLNASGSPLLVFDDAAVGRRMREVEQRARADEARRWLAERDLLSGLPRYEPPTQSLSDYGRALEVHCGIEPGAALRAVDATGFTMADLSNLHISEERFSCLLNAIAASNLHEYGFNFGFVGNEQKPE